MQDFTKFGRANTQSVGSQGFAAAVDQGLRAYMLQVYNYMAGALGVTGIVAYLVSTSPALMQSIFGTPLAFVVMFAPLIFVLALSFGINKMSAGTAQVVFWAYSAIMGLSLATIFAVYTGESIARAFFVTAALFGSMSLYGYTTKKDLSGMGSFLFMGLIGIILASLVNLFLKSTGMQFAISILSVLIFTGLTAYDTQRIKDMYYEVVGHGEAVSKAAIMGALSLYLDFINLFMQLLRFFGDRR